MADTLSQNEIDALRDAVQKGDVPEAEEAQTDDESGQIKISSYNFRKPRLFSADQDHYLRIIHEQIAKDLQAAASSHLKTTAEIKLVAIDQISYGEYVLSLASPTHILTIQASKDIGEFAVEINTAIASSMIDILLGGSGSGEHEVRELSTLEKGIFKSITDIYINVLKTGWSGLTEMNLEITGEETNPEYIQLVTPETPCINVSFDIHIAETTGVVNMCYPFTLIQSIFKLAQKQSSQMSTSKDGEMLTALGNVGLDISAVIGESIISTDQLGHLVEGDILYLNTRYDTPLDIYLGEHLSFKGAACQSRGKAAVKLLKTRTEKRPEAANDKELNKAKTPEPKKKATAA